MIDLGYEIGSGKRVRIPLNHMAILGQTQLSGKTTTMEAVAQRGDVKAISFITKPGEKSFRLRSAIPVFFSESTIEEYWKYVISIIESSMEIRLGYRERMWITKLCRDYERAKTSTKAGYKWKKPKTLRELLANVEIALPHLRGMEEGICMQLQEYLKPAIKEIERTQFSSKLELRSGINVMDITELSDGLKSLVIRSVIEWVHKHGRKIVVIIPEAWKFIPEGRSTPVKLALEGLIREGAGIGNFVWMDSQDLRGVDKMLLRSVIVWLFGVQRQKNEVANTLASIPDHPKPTATEIMQLGRGEFYVCYGNTLMRTYVQPAGMEDAHAQAISRGEERPESWTQIVRSLDAEEELQPSASIEQPGQPEISQNNENDGATCDAAAGNQTEGVDETMWKEKYELAIKQITALPNNGPDQIRRSDVMAILQDEIPSRGGIPGNDGKSPRADERGHASPAHPGTVNDTASADRIPESPAREGAHMNGSLDHVYRYIVDRAAKEQDSAILKLLTLRPELQINIERKVIRADGSTLRGALGILISEKFFDGVREFADTRKQLIRRGFLGSKAPNLQISQALQGLVEFGFLTKEETGYQAVAGMKIHIQESVTQ